MTEVLIKKDDEIKALESVERLQFAAEQLRKMLPQFEGYFSAYEIEPLVQSIMTIESSNKCLTELICVN